MSGSPTPDRAGSAGRRASSGELPDPKLRLLVIVGPTGTGKSELACRVAGSLDAEIVGCDALQVYRGLDAATAKPPASHRRAVAHHLVDCADPREDYSMARYVEEAERAVAAIARRGRVPIVVGGTGLYLRALLRGIVSSPPRDERLRPRIRSMGRRFGPAALHRWLRRLDPEAAGSIAPADTQRVARAIEYVCLSGRPWSQQLRREGTWNTGAERFASLKIGLQLDRSVLYRRLDARVERFFEQGLVREVRTLLDTGVPVEANALKGIGYREVTEAILGGADPDTTRGRVKMRTRRYAKRQMTWFRREPGLHWMDADAGIDVLAPRVISLWEEGRIDIDGLARS